MGGYCPLWTTIGAPSLSHGALVRQVACALGCEPPKSVSTLPPVFLFGGNMKTEIHIGDCVDVLEKLPAKSVARSMALCIRLRSPTTRRASGPSTLPVASHTRISRYGQARASATPCQTPIRSSNDVVPEAIADTRDDLSEYAPRMISLKIPTDKIGAIIGPGGSVIRGMIDEFGVTIDVQDDGTVVIGSPDKDNAEKAENAINALTKDVEVGDKYTGRVVRIMPFGAFVQILPGKDGMVHISELAQHRIPDVESVVSIGDELEVMVINIDNMGRIDLSHRALLEQSNEGGDSEGAPREERRGPRDRGGRDDRGGDRGPRGRSDDRRGPRSDRNDDGRRDDRGERGSRRPAGGYDGSPRRSGPPRRR